MSEASVNINPYPDYDALWHLMAMGVRTPDREPNGWSKTREGATRVAMIDTSVAVEHPNLKDAINTDLALDLFTTELGVFPYELTGDQRSANNVGAISLNTGTNVAHGLPGSTGLLTRMIDRLDHSSKRGPVEQSAGVKALVSPQFSAHGTAIAGLIGARPDMLVHEAGDPPTPLPYSGVDPYCEIIPISTNFDPEPVGMIVALLYAEIVNADVIVIPRIIADPKRTVPEFGKAVIDESDSDSSVNQNRVSTEEFSLWDELSKLIVNVSLNRPIVCAAGNENEEFGIYPACLANIDNGIISVGAVNAKGVRSGYSSTLGVTVVAPSDDSEVFDRTEVRLDERRPGYKSEGIPGSNANHLFSSFDIISTDVPGPFGFEAGSFTGPETPEGVREFGSYFCRFGGTSAASALVAGFLSLGQTTGQLATGADGLAAKAWLLGKCQALAGSGNPMFPMWGGSPVFPDK